MLEQTLLDGKFRVEREIGRGVSGVVLEATDLALERRVAIKIGPSDPPSLKARFLREGRAVAQLQSKHVAHVHGVGELPDGRPYMTMDLLEGRTFAAAIAAEGRIDPKRAIDWILQVLDALAEAHAAGLVHRDVKPSNLYLADRAGRSPIVKVLDFGLVKDGSDDRLTSTGEGFGTPTYVAPEQVYDAAGSDARSDVWGVGATLFELLTGKPPFDGDGVAGLLAAIANAPTPRMSGVPARLEAVVRRCLSKNPADRYENASVLARALEPLRSTKRSSRRPALFVGSVVGGMAVASLVASVVVFVAWPKALRAKFAAGWPRWPVVASSVAPPSIEPLPAAVPSHAARPLGRDAPISLSIVGKYNIQPSDAWLSRVRPGFEACFRASSCFPKAIQLTVPLAGPLIGRDGGSCPVDATSLACFERALVGKRDIGEIAGPDPPYVVLYVK